MLAALDLVETIRSLPLELRRDFHTLTRSGQQRVSRRSGDALRALTPSARPAHAAAIFRDAIATYRANVEHEAARHGLTSPLAPTTPAPLKPTSSSSSTLVRPAPRASRYYLPCACGAYIPTDSPRARVPHCTHEGQAAA